MPLFSKREKKTGRPEDGNTLSAEEEEKLRSIQEESRAQKMAQALAFNAQLAHGSPTVKISNFSNVQELYQKIADGLSITIKDILYCTLNTPKVEMEKLLGGQIGLEDLIFAHCKGEPKTVKLVKSAASLGLTITDNGNGYAFIKRVKPNSVAENYPEVRVGDHIASVNAENMVGLRHFAVAKILREIPEGSEFSLNLVEPIRTGFDGIAPRQTKGNPGKTSDVGTGRATLRLRSKGPATVEEAPSWEGAAIKKVDDLLEKFLGIRDPELANTLIDLSKNKENPSDFALSVDEQLGDFGFPDEFIFDLWGAVSDVKCGRLK